MRVLLTGAGGFFGAHLARGIARLVPGAELLATDLASAPDAAVASFWGAGIRYLPLDVTNRANVRAVMDAFEPEIVVHAAAVTPDAAEAAADPERITAINVGGTFTVLDVATARPRMRRVIALSSAAVFGPPAHPDRGADGGGPRRKRDRGQADGALWRDGAGHAHAHAPQPDPPSGNRPARRPCCRPGCAPRLAACR